MAQRIAIEFERMVITQSMVWGIGGTLTVTTFWGSLELYGKAPQLGPYWVFIIFEIFTRISQFFVRRSYR